MVGGDGDGDGGDGGFGVWIGGACQEIKSAENVGGGQLFMRVSHRLLQFPARRCIPPNSALLRPEQSSLYPFHESIRGGKALRRRSHQSLARHVRPIETLTRPIPAALDCAFWAKWIPILLPTFSPPRT